MLWSQAQRLCFEEHREREPSCAPKEDERQLTPEQRNRPGLVLQSPRERSLHQRFCETKTEETDSIPL